MNPARLCSACCATVSMFVVLSAESARALVIVPTYTSNVSSFSNLSQVQKAVGYVINEYESLFSDPITLNLTIDAANSTSLYLNTYTGTPTNYNYSQVRSAIIADAKTATDSSVVANLSTTDPTGGGSFNMAHAEAQALGLPVSGPATGTFTFGAALSYTFDPNHRAIAGDYDFVGLTEYAISFMLGIDGGITPASAPPGLIKNAPLDLLRYSAPGVPEPFETPFSFGSDGAYLSIDAGATNLGFLAAGSNNWGQGFDAFGVSGAMSAGHAYPLTQRDITVLDAIGYDYTGQPLPEPSTWVTASIGALIVGAFRARRIRIRRGKNLTTRVDCA